MINQYFKCDKVKMVEISFELSLWYFVTVPGILHLLVY